MHETAFGTFRPFVAIQYPPTSPTSWASTQDRPSSAFRRCGAGMRKRMLCPFLLTTNNNKHH